MALDNSIRLALKRGRGEPILGAHEQKVSDVIDAAYRLAVTNLRKRVEENGEDWRQALQDVRMYVPLSMFQVQEIEDIAEKRYGQRSAAE